MKTKNVLLPLIFISTAMFIGRDGHATTVYQWTDTDGVVHFSDVAPKQKDATETRKINFNDINKTKPARHTYSIIEQANIMAEWRKQADEQWLAQKRLELDQQRLTNEIEANRQEIAESNRDDLQPSPYYYVFPQPVNYHYQERHYGRPLYRKYSGSRQRERPEVMPRQNSTAQSRAAAILNAPHPLF